MCDKYGNPIEPTARHRGMSLDEQFLRAVSVGSPNLYREYEDKLILLEEASMRTREVEHLRYILSCGDAREIVLRRKIHRRDTVIECMILGYALLFMIITLLLNKE